MTMNNFFLLANQAVCPKFTGYRTNPAEGLVGSTIISWEDMMFNRDIPASNRTSTNCANFPNNSRSSFQAEIFDNGNIRLSYLKVSLGSTQKCTIGYEDPQYTPDHYFGFPAPIADCDVQGSCNVVPTGSGVFYCEQHSNANWFLFFFLALSNLYIFNLKYSCLYVDI